MGIDFEEKEAAEVLLSIFTDPEEDHLVRAQAAEGIGNHVSRRRRRRYVPHLVEALSDPSADVRFWSCFALSSLGSQAELPALQDLLGDETVPKGIGWSVGREARWAIDWIRRYEATRRMSYEQLARYDELHPPPELPQSGELS
jgi:hypothetical protein